MNDVSPITLAVAGGRQWLAVDDVTRWLSEVAARYADAGWQPQACAVLAVLDELDRAVRS